MKSNGIDHGDIEINLDNGQNDSDDEAPEYAVAAANQDANRPETLDGSSPDNVESDEDPISELGDPRDLLTPTGEQI